MKNLNPIEFKQAQSRLFLALQEVSMPNADMDMAGYLLRHALNFDDKPIAQKETPSNTPVAWFHFFDGYMDRITKYITTHFSSIEEIRVKRASGIFFILYTFKNLDHYFSFSPELSSGSFFPEELDRLRDCLEPEEFSFIQEMVTYSLEHRDEISNFGLSYYFSDKGISLEDGQSFLMAQQHDSIPDLYFDSSNQPYQQDFVVLKKDDFDSAYCPEEPFIKIFGHAEIVLETPSFHKAWAACLQNSNRILLQRYKEKNSLHAEEQNPYFLSSIRGEVIDGVLQLNTLYPEIFSKYYAYWKVSEEQDFYRFMGHIAQLSNKEKWNNPFCVNEAKHHWWEQGFLTKKL